MNCKIVRNYSVRTCLRYISWIEDLVVSCLLFQIFEGGDTAGCHSLNIYWWIGSTFKKKEKEKLMHRNSPLLLRWRVTFFFFEWNEYFCPCRVVFSDLFGMDGVNDAPSRRVVFHGWLDSSFCAVVNSLWGGDCLTVICRRFTFISLEIKKNNNEFVMFLNLESTIF